MKKPSVIARARMAWDYFRHGTGRKSLPRPWPAFRQLQPQWHLIDFATYVDEGFTFNSLVYSAIMFKVRAVIPAPLRAYTGDPNYPEVLTGKHSLAKLVESPNDHQSWTEFHSQNMVYLNVSGNVYVFKDRINRTLNSLRPDRVYVVPNKKERAAIKYYLWVPEGQAAIARGDFRGSLPILPEDMIHIKLPYPLDPLEGMGYGLSPMSACAQSIDVDNMITNFLNLFFQQGSQVMGVLQFDMPLTDSIVDTIRSRWKEKYGGYEQWDIGVLDRGATYKRIGLTFDEMGFDGLDARNECRILGPFGVPPILIGSRVGLERSTYSNYEGARKAVWEDTLVPELRMFEVEYQRHLKGRNAFVQFDTSQVPALQKDLPVTVSAAYTLFQMGVPANQALAAVGMRIGQVPGGDIPHLPSGSGQEQGPRADAEDDSWGMRALTCDTCGGNLKRIDNDTLVCIRCDQLHLLTSGNGQGALVRIGE